MKYLHILTLTILFAMTGCFVEDTRTNPFDPLSPNSILLFVEFTPVEGYYTDSLTVGISCRTTDAVIYYTKDGSDPKTSISRQQYTAPVPVSISTVIKAYAEKNGYYPAPVMTGTFNITGKVAVPVYNPVSGTLNIETPVSITCVTPDSKIRYTTDLSEPSRTAGTLYSGPITLNKTETLKAIAYVDSWADSSNSSVVQSDYTFKAADVLISSSGNFSTATTVSITSATPSAEIRYTLDGSTPTKTSLLYSTTFPAPSNQWTCVKAIAYYSDWTESSVITSYISIVNYGWTKTASSAVGRAITTDSTGNIYVAGYFAGTVNFGAMFGGDESRTSAGSLTTDAFVMRINSNSTFGWVRRIGGVYNETIAGIAVSGSDVYVTGSFEETCNFGADFSASDSSSTYNSNDEVFLTKVDTSGNYKWTKHLANDTRVNITDNSGTAVAVDSTGNVYVTGYFTGTVNFNYGDVITNKTSSSDTKDVFIAKYSSDSSLIAVKTIGWTGSDEASGIAVDSTNSAVYITGKYNNTVNFKLDWELPVDSKDASASNQPASFITKLDTDLNYSWSKTFNTSTPSVDGVYGTGISTDSAGNVYATGDFVGLVNFAKDFSPTPIEKTSQYNTFSAYIVKITKEGNFGWVKQIGVPSGGNNRYGRSISTDSSGNIYIGGSFANVLDFRKDWNDTFSYIRTTDPSYSDCFIMKINSDGKYGWTRVFGSTDKSDNVNSLTVDSTGNAYSTGYFNGSVNFRKDFGTASIDLTNPTVTATQSSFFLMKILP